MKKFFRIIIDKCKDRQLEDFVSFALDNIHIISASMSFFWVFFTLLLSYGHKIIYLITPLWTIILILFGLCVFILSFVLWVAYSLKTEENKLIAKCQNCSSDYKKFLFAKFGLLSLKDDVISREKQLYKYNPKDCKVYNFTTLSDTFIDYDEQTKKEDKIEIIIKKNKEEGIEYKIFYTNNEFNTPKNKKIYGEKNMKFIQINEIYSNMNFDIVLHITKNKKYGYAAVSFLTDKSNCEQCQYNLDCKAKDDGFVYKELQENEITNIYNKLEIL